MDWRARNFAAKALGEYAAALRPLQVHVENVPLISEREWKKAADDIIARADAKEKLSLSQALEDDSGNFHVKMWLMMPIGLYVLIQRTYIRSDNSQTDKRIHGRGRMTCVAKTCAMQGPGNPRHNRQCQEKNCFLPT